VSNWSAQFRSKKIALRRRLSLLLTKTYDPYPSTPDGLLLSPSEQHSREYAAAPLQGSRQHLKNLSASDWQSSSRARLAELTGYRQSLAPADTQTCSRDEPVREGYIRHSFYIRDEWGVDLPVQVVWKAHPEKRDLPVMMCLQGTNSGFHMSWGQELMPSDPIKISRGGDYAIQAADRGYMAICLELSCFGLRMERKLKTRSTDPCIDTANHLLLLGRCLVGDRASDVSSVVSWLIHGDHDLPIDGDCVSVMGQSSGGSVALFSGALDTRLHAVVATGCIGFTRDTIAVRRDAAGQNVIPGILNWMEMDDIVALCAPRPFLTVSGTRDHIWPIAGGQAVVESARTVYGELDAEDRIAAVAVEGPHQFYSDETWEALSKLLSHI
jgi:hypothetical protein